MFYWRAFIKRGGKKEKTEYIRAILLRQTLEKLGSVFVKFGQLLALRPDFLPLPYCRELFYLFENVPPSPIEEVIKIFQEDFGLAPDKIFKSFNDKPFAGASFGQVHIAYLKTGEKVAVKIQRPHIQEIIKRDIDLMKLMAKIIDVFPFGPNKTLPLVNEFEQWTKEELDYLIEADYTQAFYEKTKNEPESITVPAVYEKYCSRRVLTTQFVEGITISSILLAMKDDNKPHLRKVKQRGFLNEEAAMQLFKKSIKQIFIDGFFHANPHPANIIFTKNKGLAYIDFGIVGKLTRNERITCLRYIRSFLYRDTINSFDALLHLCDVSKVKDRAEFKREHDEIIKKTVGLFNKSQTQGNPQIIGKKLIETLKLMQKHKAIVPIDTLRYFRTIATLESIILSLNPRMELNLMADKFRNVSIINLIKELPGFLSPKTLNENLVKWLNFLEEELLDQNAPHIAINK
jgi:ubiquinone biosynthesis protein